MLRNLRTLLRRCPKCSFHSTYAFRNPHRSVLQTAAIFSKSRSQSLCDLRSFACPHVDTSHFARAFDPTSIHLLKSPVEYNSAKKLFNASWAHPILECHLLLHKHVPKPSNDTLFPPSRAPTKPIFHPLFLMKMIRENLSVSCIVDFDEMQA